MSYSSNYGLAREAFDDPELARESEHRRLLLAYLDDETIYPSLFRRLADADQNRAGRVFQILLGRPEFSWESDGEALLRERKAEYFAVEPQPAVTPVPERIAAAVAARHRHL